MKYPKNFRYKQFPDGMKKKILLGHAAVPVSTQVKWGDFSKALRFGETQNHDGTLFFLIFHENPRKDTSPRPENMKAGADIRCMISQNSYCRVFSFLLSLLNIITCWWIIFKMMLFALRSNRIEFPKLLVYITFHFILYIVLQMGKNNCLAWANEFYF